MGTAKLPHTEKHVVYRDEGVMVHAFWTSDPDAARQLRDRNTPNDTINRLWGRDDVEMVATATRYRKTIDGTAFSGWIVSSGGGLIYSDPIPTKREAMRSLRHHVAEAFGCVRR